MLARLPSTALWVIATRPRANGIPFLTGIANFALQNEKNEYYAYLWAQTLRFGIVTLSKP